MFPARKSFISQRLQNQACQKGRALSTSTQQEAQFNRAMTDIATKHDLSTAAAPAAKSCPKITQRNKRTLRALTNFWKIMRYLSERLQAVHTESQRHHTKKAEHCVTEKAQAGDGKEQELEVTPCPAQALPERREAPPGVGHFPCPGQLQLLGDSSHKASQQHRICPAQPRSRAQPRRGHSPRPRAHPGSRGRPGEPLRPRAPEGGGGARPGTPPELTPGSPSEPTPLRTAPAASQRSVRHPLPVRHRYHSAG